MKISAAQLRRKFLGDKYNAVIFKKGTDQGIYLVGGYVRDSLRGVLSQDRDFVISGDLTSFVGEVRDIFGGTVVKFRKDNMVRLALGNGLTFDFAAPMGTMEEDLSARDFTVNAIAWIPERGIIDIHHGVEDLEKNRICMISETNLRSDPLRLLRAYRFAAELGGSIEKRTRDAIKTLHNRIESVSPERITLELFHLLNSKSSSKYLRGALADGVLADILSLPDKTLEGNIREIYKLERRMLEGLDGGIKVLLNEMFSQNLTYKGLLCLEVLLRTGVRGFQRVRMSSNVAKRIQLSSWGMVELKKQRSHVSGKLFDIFVRLKEAALDVLIICGRLDLVKEYEKFKKIIQDGFLNSEDIMRMIGETRGPLIGGTVLALKRAQFEGTVGSRLEAVDFIRRRLR